MDVLSGVTSVFAVIQFAGSVYKICGQYIKNVKNATNEIKRLQDKVSALKKVLESLDELIESENGKTITTQDLAKNVEDCLSVLEDLKLKIDPKRTQQGKRKQLGLQAWKWPLKRSEVNDAIKNLESYETTFTFSLQIDQMRSMNLVHQKIDLKELKHAKGAAFDSYENQHDQRCLPGTRLDLLEQIEQWAESPHGKCIFWLNGMAGTGKSTISRTVAHNLAERQILGASFFFKRGVEDRGTAKRLFPTLAKQLVANIPQMLPQLQSAIENDPGISERALKEQFDNLLLNPVTRMKGLGKPIRRVIVIDALDECDPHGDIEILLRLLPQLQQSNSVQLRFLVTSRPEFAIKRSFEWIPDAHQNLILHEIEETAVKHDIALYFRYQFQEMRMRHSLPPEWPGEVAIRKLVASAVPLFIAAATLCRFIGDPLWNPQRRLQAILADQSTYVSPMGKIYTPVLDQLLSGRDESESQQLRAEFKEIVGAMIILATPLSIKSLSRLIDKEPSDVKCQLDQLQSVINVPYDSKRPVRLLHLSFRDFLLDDQESPFWIDGGYTHQHLTKQCFWIMKTILHKNICFLTTEGTEQKEIYKSLIRQFVPPELKYACRYWAYHLVQCAVLSNDLIGDALAFLRSHLLHWMEVMSLLSLEEEVLGILNDVETVLSQEGEFQETGPDSNLAFIQDAKRFTLKNRQIMGRAPLQLYCAGLIFAPRSSIIRKLFRHNIPVWIFQLPESIDEEWGPLLQTLEAQGSDVQCVAFSPSGHILASGSSHGIVVIWDPETGTLLQTLHGHSKSVTSVSFSPDGFLLASGSNDGTVCLWEPAGGIPERTLKGISSPVKLVKFSPDSSMLASIHGNGTIHIWDPETGDVMKSLRLRGDFHWHSVKSLTFSPNGHFIASSLNSGLVYLWEVSTGTCTPVFEDKNIFGRSVVFSPSNYPPCLVVSGSMEKKPHPMKTFASGASVIIIEGFGSWTESLAFCPGGHMIAASSTTVVRLWDFATGSLIMTLNGYSGFVNSMDISPNGLLLASGCEDKTIRLWGLEMGASTRNNSEGHSRTVRSVAISPDGCLVASGAFDEKTFLWNTKTGKVNQIIEDYPSMVQSVAFSPDGRQLAAVSLLPEVSASDFGLWIHDVTSGHLIKAVLSDLHNATSVAFSSKDSHLLASGSTDGVIHLWDPWLDAPLQKFEGHSRTVNTVAFSPNDRLLASGSTDMTICLWDLRRNELLRTLKGHSSGIESVAFSPDGRLLASGSSDCTVRLWDTTTGDFMQACVFDEQVLTVQFSEDGSYVHTALGSVRVECGHGRPNPAPPKISFEDNQWISLNGEKALWLPVEFRSSYFQIRDTTVVMGLDSGKVSIIGFH